MSEEKTIELHKQYMNREIGWNTIKKQEKESVIIACTTCGCLGDCNHEPLDLEERCALQDDLECACCKIVKSYQKEARGG